MTVRKAVADVTFKNGTIDCYDNGFYLIEDAKLTLDNVKFAAKGTYSDSRGKNTYGIYLGKSTEGVTLLLKDSEITSALYGVASWSVNCDVTIDGCKIKSDGFGVYQNGNRAPATFTIKNSEITGMAGAAIYISNTADKPLQTLTVENCTVTGPTAVEVKHTNATITGSALIASAPDLTAKTSGGGACTTGYSLAVTSNNNAGINIVDPATGTVTVTDCKFYSGTADGEPDGSVFVYNLKEGASVIVNGTAATESDKYDDEIDP